MKKHASHPIFRRSDWLITAGSGVLVGISAATHFGGANAVLAFACAGVAIALLAVLVGACVEQVGQRFGPGATGVLQSALGNLPELFICLFALKAGLVVVVKAALVGSILANLLLVLGLTFTVGGIRHGRQNIDSRRARSTTVMMLLAVAAMAVPSLAQHLHTPAGAHEQSFSLAVAVILLALFVVTLPASLAHDTRDGHGAPCEQARWPLALAIALLAVASLASALVSEWFVHALQPAMHSLRISDAFAGLVIVAIAGNAVENVVGIQLAARNRPQLAFAVVINSPLQVALVLAPALVILSRLLGFAPLTLVLPPMLLLSLVTATLIAAFITYDGESDWGEGVTLLALYAIIATVFWWG